MEWPLAGLLILIALKTAFDLYHWNKDEQSAQKPGVAALDEKMKRRIDAFLEQPKITINGKDVYFDNFEDLKASKHKATLTNSHKVLRVFKRTDSRHALK